MLLFEKEISGRFQKKLNSGSVWQEKLKNFKDWRKRLAFHSGLFQFPAMCIDYPLNFLKSKCSKVNILVSKESAF